jgi:hypothetical protein
MARASTASTPVTASAVTVGKKCPTPGPAADRRHGDHGQQRHEYLGGDESDQPGNAPPPEHQPGPHAVQHECDQQHERCQPRLIPGAVQDPGNPEVVQVEAPPVGGALYELQQGQPEAVDHAQGQHEQGGAGVVGAAADPHHQPERKRPGHAQRTADEHEDVQRHQSPGVDPVRDGRDGQGDAVFTRKLNAMIPHGSASQVMRSTRW